MKWEGCCVFVRDAADELVFEDDDVDVWIVSPEEANADLPSGAVSVVYWDEEGAVAFAGSTEPDGSFRLTCRSRPRTALLAWSEDRSYLEGSWQQGDERGSWRIVIGSA